MILELGPVFGPGFLDNGYLAEDAFAFVLKDVALQDGFGCAGLLLGQFPLGVFELALEPADLLAGLIVGLEE